MFMGIYSQSKCGPYCVHNYHLFMGSDDKFLHPIKLLTHCIVADYKCILLTTAICNVLNQYLLMGQYVLITNNIH